MAVAPEQQQPAGAASSAPSFPGLRVLDTALVPPSPSPAGSAAPLETSLPLTFFDIVWLHSLPVERIFFYRLALGADVAAILASLKDSLSQAVRAFYPLAGRLRLAPGTTGRYELHYRPGDGVAFTVAEYDDDVDRLAADEPREVAKVDALVPALPEGGALLALQATLLSARRGLAVGVTVHHAACDGASSTHFLHTWAAAGTGAAEAPPPPPVIDRTLLPDPRGLYDVFLGDTPTTEEAEFVKMSPDQLLATFALSKDDLQRVKDAVAGEGARRGVPPPRCSSLVATLGFVWTCYQRAREGSGGEGPPLLLFPVDHRSRLQPPLPDKYLGNCVGPALARAPKGELVAAGAGGLFSACAAVASAIDEAVRDIGTSSIDAWMDRIKEAAAMGVLSVAGSPRFRVYELDFGFGRPAKVDIVSVARTGAVAVAESRSSAGGTEVGVSLQPDGMDSFRKCFADAMARLAAPAEQS